MHFRGGEQKHPVIYSKWKSPLCLLDVRYRQAKIETDARRNRCRKTRWRIQINNGRGVTDCNVHTYTQSPINNACKAGKRNTKSLRWLFVTASHDSSNTSSHIWESCHTKTHLLLLEVQITNRIGDPFTSFTAVQRTHSYRLRGSLFILSNYCIQEHFSLHNNLIQFPVYEMDASPFKRTILHTRASELQWKDPQSPQFYAGPLSFAMSM